MSDYLLGGGDAEWARLERQHALWGPAFLDDLRSNHICEGSRVLEVGCGPGLLLEDLAELVGATGLAAGIELDPAAADLARRRLGERARVTTGDLRQVELGGPWQAIVVRWVLSFLPDIDPIIERLTQALAPGGLLIVQDYDHDGIRVVPDNALLDRVIGAARRAYLDQGGNPWVGLEVPAAMSRSGLVCTGVTPHCLAGGGDAEVTRWFCDFVRLHAHTFVTHGGLPAADHAELDDTIELWLRDPGCLFISPLQLTIVGQRFGQ